jgi:hypothetical protein
MAAGLTANVTAQSFNQQVGALVLNLQIALAQIQEMQTYIASIGSAGIQALPAATGGSQIISGDAATVVSAFTDLNAFASVYAGTETVSNGSYAAATGYNFNQFAKLLVGTGVH